MSDTLERISKTVMDGRFKEMAALTQSALAEGLTAGDILDQALLPAMQVVGDDFKKGKKFVPEMLLAARTMQTSLDILRPLLAAAGQTTIGTVVIGTVKGDLHDIGKNLVMMMFEGAGFKVIDLGKDVSPEKFVEAVRTHQPHIVAMSALLTTTMRSMAAVVNALKEAGLRDQVRVFIGGAPVTAEYAAQIGADAYAPNAPAAADLAKTYVRVK